MPDYLVHLSDGRKVKVTANRPPTPDEALGLVGGRSGGPGPGPGPQQGAISAKDQIPPDPFGDVSDPQFPSKSWGETATDWLPAAGGTVGGIVGGAMGLPLLGGGAVPGAVAGAAGGGALGMWAQQRIRQATGMGAPVPETVMGRLGEIGTEAGVQGGSELLGAGIGKGLKYGGTALYRKLLKPSITARLAPRAAETVETGISTRTNPFSARSVGKLEPEIQSLNAEVESAVRNPGVASRTPAIVQPGTVARRLTRVANKFAGSGADQADRNAVADVRRGFLRDQSKTFMTPTTQQVIGPTGISTQTVMKPRTRLMPMTGEDLLTARRSTGASAGSTSFGITRSAETEGRKELYHVLGDELKTLYPSTRIPMDRSRRLIDLKDASIAAGDRAANQGSTIMRGLSHAVPLAGLGYGTFGGESPGVGKGLAYWGLATAAQNPRILTSIAFKMVQAGAHPSIMALPPRALLSLISQAAREGTGEEDDQQDEFGN